MAKFQKRFPGGRKTGRRSSEDFGDWFQNDFVFPTRITKGQAARCFSEDLVAKIKFHSPRYSPYSYQEKTQDRLFGNGEPSPMPRRRMTDTFRSNVFANDGANEILSREKSSSPTEIPDADKVKRYEGGDHNSDGDETTTKRTTTMRTRRDFSLRENPINPKAKVRPPPGGFSSGLW